MAVAGDWGCGSTTNNVINLCKGYDFTLGVGDNAYASASCWTSAFSTLKPNFNSAYGNHEYSESGGIAPYKTFFGHSLTYFSFNFQNVHILVLDSNINMDAGSAQHNFATADLNAVDGNSAIDWIFVSMHHPWFGYLQVPILTITAAKFKPSTAYSKLIRWLLYSQDITITGRCPSK